MTIAYLTNNAYISNLILYASMKKLNNIFKVKQLLQVSLLKILLDDSPDKTIKWKFVMLCEGII